MGYAEVMTRTRMAGCIDKLALIDAMASFSVQDREFAEAVLRKVPNDASTAQEKASAWCTYVESLPYHRDPTEVEVFRSPKETIEVGGDCDDLALLCVAGLRCMAIPAIPEALCNEEGWAFHVRVLVGLPPLSPTMWAVVDPVWQSEREWAMADTDPSTLPIGRETMEMTTTSSSAKWSWEGPAIVTAALAAIAWVLRKRQ